MTIESVIENLGGVNKAALAIGVDQPVVSHWKNRGVPADRVLSVSRATGWKVTPHQLRPDIYPNPKDGIPPDQVTA